MPPPNKTKASKRQRSDGKVGRNNDDDDVASDPGNTPGIALDKAPMEDLEAPAPAVYFPDFYPEIPTLSQDELRSREWLTPELVTEIQQYFPLEHDISGPDGVRKKEALARQMEELFPIERRFASWKQLQQALTLFSRPWGFNSSHTTSKLICSFGKKTTDASQVNKGLRKRGPSAKDLIQCPFEIRYAYCGYGRVARFEKSPSLRYQVKITGADYNHTCGLSPASRQLALKMSKKLGAPKENSTATPRDKNDKAKPMPSVAYAVGKSLQATQAATVPLPPGPAGIHLAAAIQQCLAIPKRTKPDRPSRFRLDAFGGFPQSPQPVLNVEAPVQNGEILWTIGYCIATETGMDTVCYAESNIAGVANFINGLLSSAGGQAHKLELTQGSAKLCQWWLPLSATEDLTKARLEIITGVLQTLRTDDPSPPTANGDSVVL